MEVEHYSDPLSFAREVNLPLLGVCEVAPVPAGAGATGLLQAADPGIGPVVDVLLQTRKSLTLRSLLWAGFPEDPEFFAAGLALGREWSRRGLKVAVVDLDYRHPVVVRPRPHPNEGYVDALEYGCSFQRIAWEIVADALWVVGPGSHPPDEERFVSHPDWDRAMRVFCSRVDVALYVAPFLDRKGFTGRLSKRMDGVLLAASVERIARPALRDAFLELWGSDAPMIGCVGIGAPKKRAPAPAPPLEDFAPPSRPERPALQLPDFRVRESGEVAAEQLVREIDAEVRGGRRTGRARTRARRRVWGAVTVAGLTVLAGIGGTALWRSSVDRARVHAPELLPPGNEPVLPADLGGSATKDAPATAPPAPATPTTPPANEGAAVDLTAPQGGQGQDAAFPYRVHVASFRAERTVRDLVLSLRARGLDAWYEPPSGTGRWYRVFVGRFATYQEAADQAAWLVSRKIVDRAQAFPDLEK